jgi:hypothetical protein
MSLNKVHNGTTQENTAEVTDPVQPYDDIDLSHLTGMDTSSRTYTSLLSNNGMSYPWSHEPCLLANQILP